NSSSTSTTNTTIPPPPKPAPSSTTSSAASGLSAGSMAPKLNSGHLTTRKPSPLMTNIPSVRPSAARQKPSANSSGALIAPAVPANAPSRSSNNSKPKLKPPPPPPPLSNPTPPDSKPRPYSQPDRSPASTSHTRSLTRSLVRTKMMENGSGSCSPAVRNGLGNHSYIVQIARKSGGCVRSTETAIQALPLRK